MRAKNICIVEDYLDSLDPLDAIELIEAFDHEKLRNLISENKDGSEYVLEVLRCPELVSGDEEQELTQNESARLGIYWRTYVRLCNQVAYVVFDQILTCCIMIKNQKIDTPEKEQLVLDTVARVKKLDHVFCTMGTSLITVLIDESRLSNRAAAAIHLLFGMFTIMLDIVTALYRSMPQWWTVGKTAMNKNADMGALKMMLALITAGAILPDDDVRSRERIYGRLGRDNLEGAELTQAFQTIADRHEILISIPLPPALIKAVPGLAVHVKRLKAASNKKLNMDFVERFRNANEGVYRCLQHYGM